MSIEKTYRQVIEEAMPAVVSDAQVYGAFSPDPEANRHAAAGAIATACSLGRALAREGHYTDEFEAFEAFGLPAGFIQFLRDEKEAGRGPN